MVLGGVPGGVISRLSPGIAHVRRARRGAATPFRGGVFAWMNVADGRTRAAAAARSTARAAPRGRPDEDARRARSVRQKNKLNENTYTAARPRRRRRRRPCPRGFPRGTRAGSIEATSRRPSGGCRRRPGRRVRKPTWGDGRSPSPSAHRDTVCTRNRLSAVFVPKSFLSAPLQQPSHQSGSPISFPQRGRNSWVVWEEKRIRKKSFAITCKFLFLQINYDILNLWSTNNKKKVIEL